MLTNRRLQSGVSLIEIMIGLVVMAILMSMAAPSFVTFIQNTHIRNAAEAIQNGANLARAEAVRRNTSVQFTLAQDFSWTIGCEVVTDDCPSAIQTRSAAEGSSKAAVAASQMDVTSGTTAAFSGQLAFNGLGKEHTLPLSSVAVFDISNPSAGNCLLADGTGKMRCLRVMVSPGGQVRMCDPRSSDNSQAC